MAHEWHAGVLNASSWHGLETVESLPDAATMIRRGEETGAWPVSVGLESMRTETGLEVPGMAVVASYQDDTRKAHSAVGDRYRPLDPAEWRATVEAAVKAGARPAGAFSLRGGARILATFEIPGGNEGTGIRNHLHIVDALDGTLAHVAGGSSIRVVCANTLAMAMGERGSNLKIRHTASINDRVGTLREAIEVHVKRGETVRDAYKAARERKIERPMADAIWAALFPAPSEEIRKDKPATATRMDNARSDFAHACKLAPNYEGSTLATLWNGATWLVDREDNGTAKRVRGGGDSLDSMLFGSRGKRVEEIRNVIQVVLKDGTIGEIEAASAASHGIDHGQVGRAMLEDMI